eukprot:1304985-Rhodomonas_salina.1
MPALASCFLRPGGIFAVIVAAQLQTRSPRLHSSVLTELQTRPVLLQSSKGGAFPGLAVVCRHQGRPNSSPRVIWRRGNYAGTLQPG